jgi:hypothetical protein
MIMVSISLVVSMFPEEKIISGGLKGLKGLLVVLS